MPRKPWYVFIQFILNLFIDVPLSWAALGREGSRVDLAEGKLWDLGQQNGRGGTDHWSFPRTSGMRCYARQENATWPLTQQRACRVGQRQWAEGREKPRGLQGCKFAQDPPQQEKSHGGGWSSSTERSQGPQPQGGTSSGPVPPLPRFRCSGQAPPSSFSPGIPEKGRMGVGPGAGGRQAQGLSRRRVPGHLSHRKGTRCWVKVAVKV